jgi:dihydrofolate reductase
MATNRQIIAYMATSADGFIARANGDVSWLERPRPKGDYGMPAFLRSIDTVVMGRITWERGQELGGAVVEGKRNIVLSRTLPPYAVPGGVVESSSPAVLAERLRAEEGSDVWVMGGAQVFGAFLDGNCLDQIVVHVVPVLIGTGIPLFAPGPRDTQLALRSTRRFSDGVVRIHYDVKRDTA